MSRLGRVRDDKPGKANILDATRGSDLELLAKRAEAEAADAIEALDDMTLWVKRLAPYLDRDPNMTVAEALRLYLEDRPRSTARGAES